MPATDVIRIAAIGDLHYGKMAQPLQPLFAEIANTADVLVLCGDFTATGSLEEARFMARDLAPAAKIPIVGVLGNHEHDGARQSEIEQILTDAGVVLLDGETYETHGVGFAGVKGFCGGFGARALEPWGETVIKNFVQEAIQEALKLGSALAKLRTDYRIAVLHYSPTVETVEGEPKEIYPFLGSSRLEEPLSRYRVDLVVHGHAHNGCPEGRLRGEVPVYNVAMPVLRRAFPGRPPFRMIELPAVPVQPMLPQLPGRRRSDVP
jgi:Icc-related predicted phosphoesterase